MIIAMGINFLFDHPPSRTYRIVGQCIFVISVIALSSLSWMRCHVWQDSLTLWQDAEEKFPANDMIYLKRGNAYLEKGLWPQALLDYQTAAQCNPRNESAFYNQARVYSSQHLWEKAVESYDRVIILNPQHEKAIKYREQALKNI